MNATHRNILKKASLGDKEGEALLVQLYYDTPLEERGDLLMKIMAASNKCASRIKDVLLEQQDIEDAARAEIAKEVSDRIEEGLRGKSAGGPNEKNGEGRVAE